MILFFSSVFDNMLKDVIPGIDIYSKDAKDIRSYEKRNEKKIRKLSDINEDIKRKSKPREQVRCKGKN